MGRALPGAPRRLPIRVTTAAVAALVVLAAMALVSGATLLLLRWNLHRAVDDVARARVDSVAAESASRPPGEVDAAVVEPGAGLDVVQILDASGAVVRSVPGGMPALAPPSVGESGLLDDVDSGQGRFRARYQRVTGPAGSVLVVAGTSEDQTRDLLRVVAGLLAAFTPVVAAIAAGLVYALVGRALAPVERIRARVAEVSASELSGRVPVPATGDEISRLAVTMNEMLARLDSGRRAQLAFVGDASHELRSPLTTLAGVTELARLRGEPISVATSAEFLEPEIDRMRRLVDDLLLLAKADERGIPLHRVDVDLDEVVEAEVARARTVAGVEVVLREVPARVAGDRDALARALRNLVDNAVRHARSTVAVELSVDGAVAVVSVDDDGPGIPEADRQRVFDRFTRLDAGRAREAGGSGLGLAIVAEIARAHGGSATASRSASLGGARLELRIPT